MADEYGFVYLLGNKSMPGLFKIGHTKFHPAIRAKELSMVTGCPTPFELIAFFSSDTANLDERYIHDELNEYRLNDRREFFEASLDEILTTFKNYALQPYQASFFVPMQNLVTLGYLKMES